MHQLFEGGMHCFSPFASKSDVKRRLNYLLFVKLGTDAVWGTTTTLVG